MCSDHQVGVTTMQVQLLPNKQKYAILISGSILNLQYYICIWVLRDNLDKLKNGTGGKQAHHPAAASVVDLSLRYTYIYDTYTANQTLLYSHLGYTLEQCARIAGLNKEGKLLAQRRDQTTYMYIYIYCGQGAVR